MQTLAGPPTRKARWGLLSVLETHTAKLLIKAFIGSLALPRGQSRVAAPGPGSRWGREQPSHLAPLGAVLLQEASELGTGCPLAGALAQAFRGHLLNPAVRVQQVLGSVGAKDRQQGQEDGRVGEESTRSLASEGQGLALGIRFLMRCENSKRLRGPENSLSLEVIGGPVQPHDQILLPRFQVKAARVSNQEVSGLTSSGLGVLGCGQKGPEQSEGRRRGRDSQGPGALLTPPHHHHHRALSLPAGCCFPICNKPRASKRPRGSKLRLFCIFTTLGSQAPNRTSAALCLPRPAHPRPVPSYRSAGLR